MEKVKKRIWFCLLCVMLAAVFIGLVYYYYNVKNSDTFTEGTLIAGVQNVWGRLAVYVRGY